MSFDDADGGLPPVPEPDRDRGGDTVWDRDWDQDWAEWIAANRDRLEREADSDAPDAWVFQRLLDWADGEDERGEGDE